jgi:phenylacetate-CoA ligase
MNGGPAYWSAAERMSREELSRLQVKRLKALFGYLEEHNPFYKKKFAASGISARHIASVDDLARLPFTSKKDIVAAQDSQDIIAESGAIGESLLSVDPSEILRWHRTSGTTGKPVKIPDTMADWDSYGELSAEALYAMGLRKEDVVVVAFGYGPFIAFWGYIAGVEKIGATFIPAGSIDTVGRIELAKDFGATVFMSTPSYAIHVGETAQSMGIRMNEYTRIRLIVHTGEPTTPVMKRKIEDLWGARQRDRFGSTETGGFAFQCPHAPGIYHIQEGYVIAEVIDANHGHPVAPGEEGELILTPLFRRGMPLLRFKTENLVRLSKERACPCGRHYRSLEETENGVVIRRLDKLLKIKGVLVDPVAIENMVRTCDIFGEEYRIIFEKKAGMDGIRVQMEIRKGLDVREAEEKRRALAEELRRKMLLSIDVQFVPFATLERFEEKGKRIIDSR